MNFAIWVKAVKIIPFVTKEIENITYKMKNYNEVYKDIRCYDKPLIWDLDKLKKEQGEFLKLLSEDLDKEFLLTDTYMRKIGMLL